MCACALLFLNEEQVGCKWQWTYLRTPRLHHQEGVGGIGREFRSMLTSMLRRQRKLKSCAGSAARCPQLCKQILGITSTQMHAHMGNIAITVRRSCRYRFTSQVRKNVLRIFMLSFLPYRSIHPGGLGCKLSRVAFPVCVPVCVPMRGEVLLLGRSAWPG